MMIVILKTFLLLVSGGGGGGGGYALSRRPGAPPLDPAGVNLSHLHYRLALALPPSIFQLLDLAVPCHFLSIFVA